MSNKVSDMTDLGGVPSKDDLLYIVDSSSGNSRKVAVENLVGGWRDLRAALIGAKAAGVSDPTLAVFGASGDIRQYKFAVGNEVYLAFHIDHDIKVGSTVYPHVHWATSSTSTDIVKWEMEYTIAARDDTTPEAFPTPTTITVEAAASATAWAHQVTEHGTGFAAPVVDSLVLCHLTRITNGGTENTDDVFGLFMDLHYEAQQYGTPSRAPDFYT